MTSRHIAIGLGEDEFIVEIIHEVESVNAHLLLGIISSVVEVIRQADGKGLTLPGAVQILFSRQLTVIGNIYHLVIIFINGILIVTLVEKFYRLCGNGQSEEVVKRTGTRELQTVYARIGSLEVNSLRLCVIVV